MKCIFQKNQMEILKPKFRKKYTLLLIITEYLTFRKILYNDFCMFYVLLALILYAVFPFFLLVSLKPMLSINQ